MDSDDALSDLLLQFNLLSSLDHSRQGPSQAIFDSTHKASPGASLTLHQREGNIITLSITITVRKPFYYCCGVLVLTYQLTLITLSSSFWICCGRQLDAVSFPKYTSELKWGLIVFLIGQ